jgi:Replication-relaxation
MPPVSASKKPRLKPKGLTSTKEKILRAVGDLGIASAKQITRLLLKTGSLPYVRNLMSELAGGEDYYAAGYLCRCPFGMPHTPGNLERLYTLGRAGREYLRARGVDVALWGRLQKASPVSLSFLLHHHAVSQFLVAIAAFARVYSYQVIETRTGFAMAKNLPRLTRVTDGQETRVNVIPDAWVYIERTAGTPPAIQGFPLWIEIDCGTESKAKFQQLVLDRINFIRYKGYETYFGTPAVLLVFLAVGASMDYRVARLHTMRKWTTQVLRAKGLDAWAALFRFSTLLDEECLFDRHVLFLDPVWYLPYSDTPVSLFTPPQDKEKTDGFNASTSDCHVFSEILFPGGSPGA